MAKKKIIKKQEVKIVPTKYTYHFIDVDFEQIWTYDREKNPFGPISVETIYKNEPEVTKKKRTKNKKK